MIVTMLFTVEGARPEISRCVNVESHVNLSRLAQIIDASLGFSGAAGHLFIGSHGGEQVVYAENPGAGERAMSAVQVGDMEDMVYVYDPTADWNVHVTRLGQSALEGPTPLLVHAQGPDVVETANGPEMMRRLHEEARNLAAGLPPNMEITPLLLGYLPVMTPDRMLDRLSQVDQVAVATRMSFVGEELEEPELPEDFVLPEGIDPTDSVADLFEQHIASDPELRQIMETDPDPHSNPKLVAAFTQFFQREVLGLDEEGTGMGDLFPGSNDTEAPKGFSPTLAHYLEVLGPKAPLTPGGRLKISAVRSLIDALGLPKIYPQPREDTWAPILLGRRILENLGLVAVDGSALVRTAAGEQFLANPTLAARVGTLAATIREYFGAAVWEQVVKVLTESSDVPPSMDVENAIDALFYLGGLYDMGDISVITEELTAVIEHGQ